MPDLTDRLARAIAAGGPVSVAHYMTEANAAYYGARDPLGADGDFVTAPEISQMFGELIGLWLADLWLRGGSPAAACYVELGPGRGTLAEDALRAMRAAGLAPPVHLVETSPALRRAQAERLPAARWHDDLSTLPEDRPLLVVANEFFDALPVRQLVRADDGWRELVVTRVDGRFVRRAGPRGAAPAGDHSPGTIVETSPASVAIARELAARIARQGGAALILDYGHDRPGTGDTLQAVLAHAFADPWEAPGTRDLTAHVDFSALAEAARAEGARVCGPRGQGEWLEAMGIAARAAALAKARPDRAHEIAADRARLTAPDQMGRLFRAMALTGGGWPDPEGF